MPKPFAAGLKRMYQSAGVDEAEQKLAEFETQWNDAYPSIIYIRQRNLDRVMLFLIASRKFAVLFTLPMLSSR